MRIISKIKKSREDLSRRKDGRFSQSPQQGDSSQNNLSKTEEALSKRDNKSQVKCLTQKDSSQYSKYFFTEIDQEHNDPSKKLNNIQVKTWTKPKSRDQSLVKNNKTNNESKDQIPYHRKSPSQLEIGAYTQVNNNRPKTNYSPPPQNNNKEYNYYTKNRAYTTSSSDQNDKFVLNDRQKRVQELKNKQQQQSNKNIESQASSNRPTLFQSQKMDAQFKNFFSTSARSVSAKRNESLIRNNLLRNNRKNNYMINEQQNDLYNQNQSMQNNSSKTRNQINHYYTQSNYNSGYKSSSPYTTNHSNNNSPFMTNNNSRNYNQQHNIQRNDSQIRNNQQLRNNFINDASPNDDKTNNLSKSAIYQQTENYQLKNIANTSYQDTINQQRNSKNSQEIQRVYKMNQSSPYSLQNQQNIRRRIQTVHHYERRKEYQQPPKLHPRIHREQLVPIYQVKEEDHFQQTLDSKENQRNAITIPQKVSQ